MPRNGRIVISQLYQGTSNQPDYKRREGQVEEALNVRLDTINGAAKRNNTALVAEYSSLDSSNDYHWTSLRNFRIAINADGVKVFDENGVERTVTTTENAEAYLSTLTSIEDVDTVVYLNSVLILNRSVVPTVSTSASYAVAGEVDEALDLPTNVIAGVYYRVLTTVSPYTSGYYKSRRANPGVNDWDKVAAPSDAEAVYDRTTMPIQLLYTPSTDSFSIQYLTWEDRKSGDRYINRKAPFVGSGIRCMTVWGNRLWFFGKDSVKSSETLSSFQEGINLWVDDVATIVDTDPISLDIDRPNAGFPLRASPLGADCLLVCENAVLSVTSGEEPPSPLKFNLRFRQVATVQPHDFPLSVNGFEAVIVDRNKEVHLYGWRGIVEGVQPQQETLNAHRRDILQGMNPQRAFFIDHSIFVTTDSETVAVFDRYVAGDQLVQAAWSTYVFEDVTYYIDRWNGIYNIIQSDHDNTYSHLSYVHKTDYDEPLVFTPRLDRYQEATIVGYDRSSNRTTVSMSNRACNANTYVVEIVDSAKVKVHKPISVSGFEATLRGNLQGKVLYIGFAYECRLQLSKLWSGTGAPMLQTLGVIFDDATNFVVKGGRNAASLQTMNTYNAVMNGQYGIGTQTLGSGLLQFSAAGDARKFVVQLECSGPGTATWTAIEYVLNVMER